MNLVLVAASENGNVYQSTLNTLKVKEKEENTSWQTGRKCQLIRFSMDSTEIFTAENDQINIWSAQSGTNIRNIQNIKSIKLFFSVLDVWNLNDVSLIRQSDSD